MSENDSKKESNKRDSIKSVREDMETGFDNLSNQIESLSKLIVFKQQSTETDTPVVSTPSNEVSSSTSKMITETDVEIGQFAGVKCVWKHASDKAHFDKTKEETGVGEVIPNMNKCMVMFGKKVAKNGGMQKLFKELAEQTGGIYHERAKMVYDDGIRRTCPTISYPTKSEVPDSLTPLLMKYGIQIQGEVS